MTSRFPREGELWSIVLNWSDRGTPGRVISSLRREGMLPDWLQELATTA